MGLNRAQDTVIIVSSVFPALAIIAMLFRIRARSITSKRLQADDYWLVVATVYHPRAKMMAFADPCRPLPLPVAFFTLSVLLLPVSVSTLTSVHQSDFCYGERFVSSPVEESQSGGLSFATQSSDIVQRSKYSWPLLQIAYMIQFFYIVSVSCVKISVLLFYKRTFHSLSRYFIHCVYATLTITVLWTITFSIATLLQEWPIAAFWDKSIPSRWKIDSTQMYIWLAITDILLDVVTLGLPIRMILKLRMSSRNKWALAGVFTIGSIAVIAGAVRLVYARQFHRNHFDVTYAMHHLAIW
jgi:hypothetical protein